MPDIPGHRACDHVERSLSSRPLPQRILIAGGGYIANEFAGIFHEFGAKVTLVNRSDQILRGYDEQIRDRLLQISMAKGIQFLSTRRSSASSGATNGVLDGARARRRAARVRRVDVRDGGRVPNTDGLGLDSAGVELDANGAVRVDDDSRSTCPSIYAVGDVTNRVQLTPVAIREGQAFADTVFGNKPTQGRLRLHSLGGVQPSAAGRCRHDRSTGAQQARLGQGLHLRLPADEERARGRNERALYKLVVDATDDRIVGAHMIGPDAPEILQALAVAVKAGLQQGAARRVRSDPSDDGGGTGAAQMTVWSITG